MIAWLNQVANWISRIRIWLWEARQIWIAAFAIPCVLLLCWIALPNWEPRIRYTGMLLELMGLATVALGIRETRSLFSRPSLLQVARAWFSRFPGFRQDVKVIVGSGGISMGGASVSAFGSSGPAPTATLEERVAILEKSVNQAHLLIHEANRKIAQETQQRQSEIEVVKRELEDGDSKNKQLLEAAAAGGLYLETTGVFWLAFGITLATASNEIAKICCGT